MKPLVDGWPAWVVWVGSDRRVWATVEQLLSNLTRGEVPHGVVGKKIRSSMLHGLDLRQWQGSSPLCRLRAITSTASCRASSCSTTSSPVRRFEEDVLARSIRSWVWLVWSRSRSCPGWFCLHYLIVERHETRSPSPQRGNRHDITQLLPLLDAIPLIRVLRVRPCRKLRRLYADRGCDSDKYRCLYWKGGIKPVTARRDIAHGSGLGKARWVGAPSPGCTSSNDSAPARSDAPTFGMLCSSPPARSSVCDAFERLSAPAVRSRRMTSLRAVPQRS